MKREILFRGWSEIYSRWNFGHFVCYCTPMIYDLNKRFPFQVNPDTVGQYTGLTDKNGKRIFEGDVLKGGAYLEYEVKWDYEVGGWNISEYGIKGGGFEVVGNIHEK